MQIQFPEMHIEMHDELECH
jgi:hypothetical protein